MIWWLWILSGALCLIAELAIPTGFVLFFFGLGAIVTGCILGLSPPFEIWVQITLWIVASIVLLVSFRNRVMGKIGPPPTSDFDSLVGTEAVAKEKIVAGGRGKVESRGTGWDALNTGAENINAGGRCRVVGLEGLLLHVKAL